MAPSDAGRPIISAVSHRSKGSRIYPSASATFTSRNRSVAVRTSASVGSPGPGDPDESARVAVVQATSTRPAIASPKLGAEIMRRVSGIVVPLFYRLAIVNLIRLDGQPTTSRSIGVSVTRLARRRISVAYV